MTAKRFVSCGECMIEMAGGLDGQWKMGIAGDTLNTAWHFRNATDADDWRVSYVTALGDDRYSGQISAFIRDAGIETDDIQVITGKRPGLYLIGQEDGDRFFTYWRENSAARRMADDISRLASGFSDADVLYLSGITLAILSPDRRTALIELLGQLPAKTRIVFDPNIRPALWEDPDTCKQVITEVAKRSSIVLPSFDDEANLFGDASPTETVLRYRDLGVSEVIVKNGSKACTFLRDGQAASLETPSVSNVVDATGAGDSFNAAFLAARFANSTTEDAIAQGQALSARVIQTHGALLRDN
ncbi:sugar kinase [Thalassospira sp.]|uniref:sugar kinase n=1 Tax=Thalassospira sp. TaxID=1912094 RepID=UPI000C4AD52B|nr:sugar kinase [Thalassospira sp.]MBC06091.1 2-dehydro-3-deoxygluconokinase [Thalassospira sp.]|tara:strand:+ start:602 stop:1504 length:903 start_codon:yes stop_codon:yes gene_type:complete